MTSITVRAPGKVVLLGEYAVLDGSPGLVAAVDIGVEVIYHPGETLEIQTPTGDVRFARAALTAADAPTGQYLFGNYNSPDLQSKPGLGGSAAATVAATFAARHLNGLKTTPKAVFEQAFKVHHAVQGSGSGVDVAASTYGGLTRFVAGHTPQTVEGPAPLVIWSGRSAKTGPRVAKYLAWQDRASFARTSAALVDGYAADPIGCFKEAGRLLKSMANEAGIDYLTPELERIHQLAVTHGGAAKPSGAGGGDCAVALVASPEAELSFRWALKHEGFTVLSTTLASGVHLA